VEYLVVLIPSGIIIVGAIVHIEVSIAVLRTDVKWIKKYLNDKEK